MLCEWEDQYYTIGHGMSSMPKEMIPVIEQHKGEQLCLTEKLLGKLSEPFISSFLYSPIVCLRMYVATSTCVTLLAPITLENKSFMRCKCIQNAISLGFKVRQ